MKLFKEFDAIGALQIKQNLFYSHKSFQIGWSKDVDLKEFFVLPTFCLQINHGNFSQHK